MTQSISHLAGHVREAGSAETYDPQVLDSPRSQLAGIEPISVWLTDFAMNTRLTDGCAFVIATPEQTGRTNRSIDSRGATCMLSASPFIKW